VLRSIVTSRSPVLAVALDFNGTVQLDSVNDVDADRITAFALNRAADRCWSQGA
jgi:hypothetical protein